MYRIFMGMLLLCIPVISASACDICGCSGSASYFGTIGQLPGHLVGARYGYRVFDNRHPADLNGNIPAPSREFFHQWELFGRWMPHERIQVLGGIPLQYIMQREGGVLNSHVGVGDAWVQVHYAALKRNPADGAKFRQEIWVGGGLKLPTGNFKNTTDSSGMAASLFPGSGSLDFQLMTRYNFVKGNWSFGAEAMAIFPSSNPVGYTFGKRVQGMFRGTYRFRTGKAYWYPSLTSSVEFADKDYDKGERNLLSGGFSVWGGVAMDIGISKWILGVSGQMATYSHVAYGLVTPGPRIQCQIIKLF